MRSVLASLVLAACIETPLLADSSKEVQADASTGAYMTSLELAYRRYDGLGGAYGGGARLRWVRGPGLAWALGVDAEAQGGTLTTYRLDGYILGLGHVTARGDTIAVSAGVGLFGSAPGNGVAEIPIALDAAVQVGALRFLAWGRISWYTSFDGERDYGPPLGDTLRLGVGLRLGTSHLLASSAKGEGPYLGVTWGQWSEAKEIGVVLGWHVWGG